MNETIWLVALLIVCQFVTLAVVLRQNGAMADRLLALVDVDSAKVVSAMRNPRAAPPVDAKRQDAPSNGVDTPAPPAWSREYAQDFDAPPRNEA